MPSNSELDQIIADICCTPDGECTATRLCEYCLKDKQRLLAWRNRAVEKADRKTLETIASLLNGDHNQVDVVKGYIRNKLEMYAGRAAHSSRKGA